MAKYTTLGQIQKDIKDGKTNCVQLVDYYLQQIEKNEHLNAYCEVFEDEARHRAAELDKKYRKDPHSVGRLFGAVISLKDVICYAGHEVTAAATILRGFKSLFSATAVERILAEDAIIIGRTNCDQFAMGSDNTNSIYGAVLNADDPSLVPGGSSGGSAVAVQADTCLASLGSDTGGSVRQPADFCNVIGFKPSYGRISRHGLLAYGSSFDQIGTLSHSVADAALLLEVMAGEDDFDATASSQPVEPYFENLEKSNPSVKIAYFGKVLDADGIDPDIRNTNWAIIDKLRVEGHTVESVDFDLLDYVVPAYYVLTTAEASSNLSRFDGVRYGYRTEGVKTLEETYRRSRTEGFSEEVKRRIILGTFVLSAGYYDAYYAKAQKVRRLVSDRFNAIFAEYDFILMPNSPIKPWKVGEKADDPVAMYLADIYSVIANMGGIPAIALGKHKFQLMAAKGEDGKLLAFAHRF
ncbi:MAG: Asp-tRNA(Asn)/Glu-tRNA(Gln) amidotransferase subunit GatA [Saprospiraceae bacterium]|nr:Asp-tRNA(Asn)/Glu-tRNA(Gln) amidotransferase subunit GatA [Saprospiraceae bacterium]